MYLFGFGSLININSAQKSFQRVLKQEDLIPVQIKGFERVWNALESIKFDKELVNGVFLNLKKNENSTLFGVVIKITPQELEILKLREKNYSCITISSKDVQNRDFDSDLIAFMTINEEKIANKNDENSFIPLKYIDILIDGFKNYDESFVNDFKKCLENLPFPLKEGTYTFSDPIQNSAAREGINKKNETK
ncbi:MAG: hypothetical protein U5K55_14475 [Aliarcobacter sp.]|nr:hypothetical protein [Aliarcobacter sp.]